VKRVKANDFRHHIQFYEQVNVPNGRGYSIQWEPTFKLWCRERTVFREQLEAVISGGNTYRDRKEMETRFTKKITSGQRFMYEGFLYEVSIVGDTVGDKKYTRFLGETLKDGGA